MEKPRVLLLGGPIEYHHDFFENTFKQRFEVVQNNATTRQDFVESLKTKRFPKFSAILRPSFQSGAEMGQWDNELIDLLPASVRIFGSAGAGYDSVDVEALGRRQIWYANGAGCSDEAVSDTTLYMILSVFRNFTRQQLAARTADPDIFQRTHKLVGSISHNPAGHNLGLVGLGSISKRLVPKAKALGMVIHYFDVNRQSSEEEKRLDVTSHPSLESLLNIADCVSVHTPLNAHTKHLINKDTLAMMKNGARLINTSRGKVVEETAMIEALQTGKVSAVKLSAVGLDVHYHEPQVSSTLARMDNVTLTTHNGGGAIETRANFELNAMQNLLAVVGPDGDFIGKPLTPVNEKAFSEASQADQAHQR